MKESLEDVFLDHRKLAEARKEMSQAEVARRVGVTPQAISNIETGKSQPSPDLLLRLCLLYQVGLQDVILRGKEKILAAS